MPYIVGDTGIGSIFEDQNPLLGGDLNINSKSIIGSGSLNIIGIITATSFVGDGSNITGISTLNIIDYGVGLGGGGSGGGESYWVSTDVGIHTLSSVGIGTTNPTSTLTVEGDVHITDIVTAKRFETDWPGSTDYNFVAGYLAGELVNDFCEYNVLIGYQAGYDLASSDDNIAIGRQALFGGSSNNASTANVALGYRSLYGITIGDYNISLGYSAGQGLTSGSNNVILGYFAAGSGVVSGSDNISIGNQSAYNLSSGLQNVFVGSLSGYNITTGDYNVCVGHESGYNLDSNQLGNVLLGYESGFSSDLGDYNVAVGYQAGFSQEADYSVFMGYQSGYASASSTQSVAVGYRAGYDLEGNYNVAIGADAMYSHNGSGAYNVAIGYQALYQDGTNSGFNIAIGYQALYGETTTTGVANIGIGYQAGDEITTGNGNLLLGNFAGNDITTGSGNVVIYGGLSDGLSIPSATQDNQLVIGSGTGTWITGDDSYNVSISGALSKGSGSFKINHPLPELSETTYLVHSFIEGPQADLIYRGSTNLVSGNFNDKYRYFFKNDRRNIRIIMHKCSVLYDK